MKRRTFRLPQPPRAIAITHSLGRTLLRAFGCALLLAAGNAHAAAVAKLPDGIQRSLAGPDVVITAGKTRTVYEYRQNGQLRIVKIVPRFGRPYYLVPADQTRGFGDLGQARTLLPQWVIVEF